MRVLFQYRYEAKSWTCYSSDEDKIRLSLFRTIQKDFTKKTIPAEDYYKYFELDDEKNVVAKYMSEHHDEIKTIISPGLEKHERFTLHAVIVKEDGSIQLAFLDDGQLCLDKITMKRGDCPCFRITGTETSGKYDISVMPEGDIHRTIIEGVKRTLKYGYKGSVPIVDVDENGF